MVETIQRLAGQMVNGEVSIPELLNKISNKADILKDAWNNYVTPNVPAVLLLVLFAALSLVEAFAGKRLLGVQKAIASFILGFLAGAVYIHPILAEFTEQFFVLDRLLVGVIVGVIMALICRAIYFCAYVGVFGYFAYFIMINGVLFEFTKGSKLIAAIVAAGVIALILIFRKVVEIASTSLLGAWFTLMTVDYAVTVFTDGTQLSDVMYESLYVQIAIFAFIAITGFLVQYRTRRRW